MYVPYLYGQKFELQALRELVTKLATKRRVNPLIDPVTSKNKDLVRTLSLLEEQHLRYFLIINPDRGDFEDKPEGNDSVKNWFTQLHSDILPHAAQLIPTFKITAANDPSELKQFLAIYKERTVALVHKAELAKIPKFSGRTIHIFSAEHTSSPYQDLFVEDRILIRDGFNRQAKNALYPEIEHYDDLNVTYADKKFQGFGDYTITGDYFSSGGGEAYAVAIHMTRVHPHHGTLQMLHFVSDTITVPPRDNSMKYGQAVRKLAEYVNKRKSDFKYSSSLQLFVHDAKTLAYHGLGEIKGRSIRHHIETIEHLY